MVLFMQVRERNGENKKSGLCKGVQTSLYRWEKASKGALMVRAAVGSFVGNRSNWGWGEIGMEVMLRSILQVEENKSQSQGDNNGI